MAFFMDGIDDIGYSSFFIMQIIEYRRTGLRNLSLEKLQITIKLVKLLIKNPAYKRGLIGIKLRQRRV